jgi:hypothetical protein
MQSLEAGSPAIHDRGQTLFSGTMTPVQSADHLVLQTLYRACELHPLGEQGPSNPGSEIH